MKPHTLCPQTLEGEGGALTQWDLEGLLWAGSPLTWDPAPCTEPHVPPAGMVTRLFFLGRGCFTHFQASLSLPV